MRAAVVAALIGLGGCGDALEHQSQVDELRILAIAAEPPEAAPGGQVALRALWFEPGGGTPTFTWTQCVLVDPGDPDSCASPPEELAAGAALDDVPLTVPTSEGTVRIGLELCLGVECREGRLEAFKRVQVATRASPNANPVISAVALDTPSGIAAGARGRITLTAAPGSAEPFETEDGSPRTEELLVSWFATAGAFEEERTTVAPFVVEYRAPDEPGSLTSWAVLRDGRGGVSWQTLPIEVRAR